MAIIINPIPVSVGGAILDITPKIIIAIATIISTINKMFFIGEVLKSLVTLTGLLYEIKIQLLLIQSI